MHRAPIPAGKMIYREGDPATTAYLILSGEVAMERRSVTVNARDGSIIGFSALVDWPYRSTATATRECTLLAFTRRELKALIRSNPNQAMTILDGRIELFAKVVTAMEEQAAAGVSHGPDNQRRGDQNAEGIPAEVLRVLTCED